MKQKEIYDFDDQVSDHRQENDFDQKVDDIPPSLKCKLCKKLIEGATLTPCCFSSCCYECLKSCVTSSHRPGICPIAHCRESEVLAQDLIPNHVLNRAADWFIRQKISLSDQITMELTKRDEADDIDVKSLGETLLREAKSFATQEEIN